MKILLSGKPGVGKSTVLSKVRETLLSEGLTVSGCLVKEIRELNNRLGFEVHYMPSQAITVLGHRQILFSSKYVSNYSINISGIDQELIPFMNRLSLSTPSDVMLFDEIGRMQNMSPSFIPALDCLLSADIPLIATIVNDPEEWAQKYKEDPNFFYVIVDAENRDSTPDLLNSMIRSSVLFNIVSLGARTKIHELFSKYLSQSQFPELKKLFDHAIPYVANNKIRKRGGENTFSVEGNHGLRIVTPVGQGYSCTCEFYSQESHPRECSHIQSVMILNH